LFMQSERRLSSRQWPVQRKSADKKKSLRKTYSGSLLAKNGRVKETRTGHKKLQLGSGNDAVKNSSMKKRPRTGGGSKDG